MSKFNMTEYMRVWRKNNREKWNEYARNRVRAAKEIRNEEEMELKYISQRRTFFIKDGHKIYIHRKGKKYYYEIFFKDFREHYISQYFGSRTSLNKDLMYAI